MLTLSLFSLMPMFVTLFWAVLSIIIISGCSPAI